MWIMAVSLLSSCSDSITGSKVTGADPGVLEAPIAYVKRPIPLDDNDNEVQSDMREPLFFGEGGDVYLRSNSTVTATVTNITASVTGGQGDVKDLKPNFDGTKLAFSLRLFDPDPNNEPTPRWNIYEYDLTENKLRCVMDFDITTVECDGTQSEKGDDIAPAYLPDGRIVFSSNRQTNSRILMTDLFRANFKALDEDEDEWAMYLHVMDDDGTNIKQISYNQSHDLDPTILTHHLSGQILFTRWDNATTDKGMHLYTIKPDGTEQQILYGRHSHDTGNNNAGTNDATIQFSQPEEMEDGRIMVIARPNSGTYGGGSIMMVDVANYINNTQTVLDPANPSVNTAQTVGTINNVSSANELSLDGRYSAAWPLWDGSNRVLLSKSTCEILADGINRPCIEPYLSAATVDEVSPVYAIWLYDLNNEAQKIVVQAQQGMVFTDIVAIQSRSTTPDYIYDHTSPSYSASMDSEEVGAIHIKSIYDFGNSSFNGCFLTECTNSGATTLAELADPAIATADQRPARFVRFVTSVALPDEDDPDLDPAPDLQREAFGPQRNQAMREIIGYAPVEPDGSVKVKVPANIPLAISVLDRMGRRIGPRHQNWFHVRPGETLECTGCHTQTTTGNATPLPHHRADAEAPSINGGTTTGSFLNTYNVVELADYSGAPGQTMAEVRFDYAEGSASANDDPEVNADIEFVDYWTDTINQPLTADASFSYKYSLLDTLLPSPASAACDSWNYKCRILANYQEHILPMWSLPRTDAMMNDVTCTLCHANVDAMAAPMVPAGQLNLTGITDPEDNDPRVKSYLELFFGDAGQEIDMTGALVNIQITQQVPILDANGDPVLDANGNPTFDTITIDDPAATVAASMSGNGARASYFMEKMTGVELDAGRALDNATHMGYMTDHELKLISEWLDIGAQYYNDPRDLQCITDGLC